MGIEDGKDDYTGTPRAKAPAKKSATETSAPAKPKAGSLGPDERTVAEYEYRDPGGELIASKRRVEDTETGEKRFDWKPAGRESFGSLKPLRPKDLPLFGADILAETDAGVRVYVCEGEKATLAARAAGLNAVTWSGSGSNPPTPIQLEILRGFEVWIWPDNDVPGRKVARKIRAELRRMGMDAKTIRPPISLPEKGDAYDYFVDLSGTVKALEDGDVVEASASLLESDAIQVLMPTDVVDIALTFTEMRYARGARGAVLDTVVRVSLLGTYASAEEYVGRFNMLSSSGKRELRQELGAHFKQDLDDVAKDVDWLEVLVKAIPRAERLYMGQSRAVDHAHMGEPEPERFLIQDLFPLSLPSVLYAPGSTGKSMIASYLGTCVAYGIPWLDREVQQGAVIYLDYESNEDDWNSRVSRILEGLDILEEPGRMLYWSPQGVPLPDLVDPLRADIARYGVELVIIDSALLACRGKAEDSDVAGDYFNAISRLGVTSITLAHVTGQMLQVKGIPDRPFGSVFWRELPRRNIFLKGSEYKQADSTTYTYAMHETKSNAKSKRPFSVSIRYEDPDGPIRMAADIIEDDPELMEGLSVPEQIEYVLKLHKSATIAALAEETGIKRDTLAATLRRLNGKRFIRVTEGGGAGQEAEWALLTNRDLFPEDAGDTDLPVD